MLHLIQDISDLLHVRQFLVQSIRWVGPHFDEVSKDDWTSFKLLHAHFLQTPIRTHDTFLGLSGHHTYMEYTLASYFHIPYTYRKIYISWYPK